MTYEITARFKVEALSAREAQAIAAACIVHYNNTVGLMLIRGIGGARGSVTIREATPDEKV